MCLLIFTWLCNNSDISTTVCKLPCLHESTMRLVLFPEQWEVLNVVNSVPKGDWLKTWSSRMVGNGEVFLKCYKPIRSSDSHSQRAWTCFITVWVNNVFPFMHVEAWSIFTCHIYINILSFSLEVLVHGSAEATEHLKQHCLKHVCPHVYAPHIEETIDVTSDLSAYKV